MGKSLMIQEADDERLESLKKRLGLESKIGVVRAGIDLKSTKISAVIPGPRRHNPSAGTVALLYRGPCPCNLALT